MYDVAPATGTSISARAATTVAAMLRRVRDLSCTFTVLVGVRGPDQDRTRTASRQFAVSDSVARGDGSDEQLCVQLRAPLRAIREKANERVPDRDRVACIGR